MKSNTSKKYHTRVVVNILFSTVLTCLIEVFLVANLSMMADYALNEGSDSMLLVMIAGSNAAIVLVYVLIGILIFSVTFLALQEKSLRYIGRISDAMENISQGDLNTSVDVVGDDEFSGMAENLNHMVAEIRDLMDRERESERTKNELITNVAHDLRTPLTSIIGYLELLSGKPDMPEEIRGKYINIAYTKARRLEKLIEDLFGFTKLN